MINLNEINLEIEKLESGATTFKNCSALADLYIVREYLTKQPVKDEVIKEYSDILPSYKNYQSVKRNFQLGNSNETALINTINLVCKEISEFISILYNNTDIEAEQKSIYNMLIQLSNKYNK